MAASKIIVALDYDTFTDAKVLINKLGTSCDFYKIGYQLFFSEGMEVVERVLGLGKRVFLDLKLYDIPTTVGNAVKDMPAGVSIISVHGGLRSIAACVERRPDIEPFYIYGLSSNSEHKFDKVGDGDGGFNKNEVLDSWHKAVEEGAKGLIVSGALLEFASHFKQELGERNGGKKIKLLSPGIRLLDKAEKKSNTSASAPKDHIRPVTPAEASRQGVDYIVVGRPITRSEDPSASFNLFQQAT